MKKPQGYCQDEGFDYNTNGFEDGGDYCHNEEDDCEEKVFVNAVVHFFIVPFHGGHARLASVRCK